MIKYGRNLMDSSLFFFFNCTQNSGVFHHPWIMALHFKNNQLLWALCVLSKTLPLKLSHERHAAVFRDETLRIRWLKGTVLVSVEHTSKKGPLTACCLSTVHAGTVRRCLPPTKENPWHTLTCWVPDLRFSAPSIDRIIAGFFSQAIKDALLWWLKQIRKCTIKKSKYILHLVPGKNIF